MKKSEISFGLIRIPLDIGLAVLACFTAYYLRQQEALFPFIKKPDLGTFPALNEFFMFSIISGVVLAVIFAFFKMYSLKITVSFASEFKKIIAGISIWLMAIITYYFVLRDFPFSRLVLLYTWFFAILFIVFSRFFIHLLQNLLLRIGIGRRRILLIGEGELLKQFKKILKQKFIYEIVAVTGSLAEIPFMIKKLKIEEIIQTKSFADASAENVLDFCRENHLQYHFVPDLLEVQRTNVEIKMFDGLPLISLKPTPLDGWGKIFKRTFDITVSLILLVLLSPLFLLIAILIKIDSRGPVFFKYLDDGTPAWRIGQFARRFCCVKFRTMKQGTHSLRYSEEFQKRNLRSGTPLIKIENDPRITRLGRFLRRYSLDELPQLWNVLKGEMSLVGPRPHLSEEVAKYQKHHKFVFTIKPGITGLAQISGRSDLLFEEEIKLDTYYIENWSISLDIKILLKTIFAIFRKYKE